MYFTHRGEKYMLPSEEQLTSLQEALARGARAGDSECAEAMRDLVNTVTVFRDTAKSGGVKVEIVGRLTALLTYEANTFGMGWQTGASGSRSVSGRCDVSFRPLADMLARAS